VREDHLQTDGWDRKPREELQQRARNAVFRAGHLLGQAMHQHHEDAAGHGGEHHPAALTEKGLAIVSHVRRAG
jgi:hypothetical protein